MSANGDNLLRVGVAAVILLGAILACGPTPDGGGISVVINSPVDGSVVTVGQAVEIDSTSTSEAGIDRVDLTVSGGVIRHDSPSEETPPVFRIVQTWTPTEEGQVTVSVVAYDANGASARARISLQVAASAAGGDGGATAVPDATEVLPTELIPTETPPPPVTTEAGCTLDSKYVADVTIPDGTIMSLGAAYVKTWKVRNSGTCDWEAGYDLIFVAGAQMSGPASVSLPAVAAGAEVDISVNLVAPSSYGTFKGTWRVRSDDGEVFGTNLTVMIEVPSPATDTPTPTATPTVGPTVKPTVATEEPSPAPYTQHVIAKFSIAAGEAGGGAAECPEGAIAVGGGFTGSPNLAFIGHYQHTNRWVVYAKNTSTISGEGHAYVVCLHDAPAGTSATREHTSVTVQPKTIAEPAVACPPGSVVTGGGWMVGGGGLLAQDEAVRVRNSQPSTNGWELMAYNSSQDEAKPLKVYAVCLSSGDANVAQTVGEASIPSHDRGEATANCPAGTMVTGGGFSTVGPFDMEASFKPSDQQWKVIGVNLSPGSNRTLTSYALCLSYP